jgi:dynein heavy chain
MDKLSSLYDNFLVDTCYFVRKFLPEPVKTVDNNIAMSSMRIMDCYFVNYIETEIKRISKDDIINLESMIS